MKRRFSEIMNSISFLFGRSRKQTSLEAEIEFHLQELMEENIANGMPANEARKAALREFGNVEQLKGECRDSWGFRVLFEILREFRLGVRVLAKNKNFSVAVILCLGLCIGANAIIFTISHSLLRAPNYADPDRVYEIFNSYPGSGFDRLRSSAKIYKDYRDNTNAFEHLTLVREIKSDVRIAHRTRRLTTRLVSADYFRVFGIQPIIGSLSVNFPEGEDDLNPARIIILSEHFWKSEYGGDQSILGKTIHVDGWLTEIVGVARSPNMDDLSFVGWMPWIGGITTLAERTGRHNNHGNLWGRLKDGVSLEQAKEQVFARDQHYLEHATPTDRNLITIGRHETKFATQQETAKARYGKVLYLLQGSMVLVLLIGIINVSNLLMVRSSKRMAELAIRRSLGAAKWNLFILNLTECLVLSIAASVFGAFVAATGLEFGIQNFISSAIALESGLLATLNQNTILFLVGMTVTVGVLLAIATGIQPKENKLSNYFIGNDRRATKGKKNQWIRSHLISLQVAMTVVLFIAATLLLKSFHHSITRYPGFDQTCKIAFQVNLSRNHYDSSDKANGYRQALKQALLGIPGVKSVVYSEGIPGVSKYFKRPLARIGELNSDENKMLGSYRSWVDSGFFDSLGISLLKGRYIQEADFLNNVRSVVVDRNFAEKYFRNIDPIGKIVALNHRETDLTKMERIVGVVESVVHCGLADQKLNSFSGETDREMIYFNKLKSDIFPHFYTVIESERTYEELMPIVRNIGSKIDPMVAFHSSGSIAQLLEESLSSKKALLTLITIAGGIAILLSGFGISSVLSYEIASRTREIGIRIILGASFIHILKMVAKRGLLRIGLGILIGSGVALIFSPQMVDYLFNIEPRDPSSFILSVSAVFFIACVSTIIPAIQAVTVEPSDALRAE